MDRLEADGSGIGSLALAVPIVAALVIPRNGIVLVDVPSAAHVFVLVLALLALVAAARESLTRLVAAVGRGGLIALAVPVAVVALLAAVVRAPGRLIVRAPVLPAELRFVGPVALLGALALGLVLEAAAGPILGLILLGGADIAPVAGPLTAALLCAAGAGLAVLALVLLAALTLALLVVLALTAIGLLPPTLLSALGVALSGLVTTLVAALEALLAAALLIGVAVTALAPLVLLLAPIAALATVLLVPLVLHLRLATGHPFVDSAFASALLVAHLLGLLAPLRLGLLALVAGLAAVLEVRLLDRVGLEAALLALLGLAALAPLAFHLLAVLLAALLTARLLAALLTARLLAILLTAHSLVTALTASLLSTLLTTGLLLALLAALLLPAAGGLRLGTALSSARFAAVLEVRLVAHVGFELAPGLALSFAAGLFVAAVLLVLPGSLATLSLLAALF